MSKFTAEQQAAIDAAVAAIVEKKTPAKKPCPITRSQFREHAAAIELPAMVLDVKEFQTGSFGWHHNGKLNLTIDGVALSVTLGILATVSNSKEAAD